MGNPLVFSLVLMYKSNILTAGCSLNSLSPSSVPRRYYGNLFEIRGDKYADVIDNAPKDVIVIIHIYDEVGRLCLQRLYCMCCTLDYCILCVYSMYCMFVRTYVHINVYTCVRMWFSCKIRIRM